MHHYMTVRSRESCKIPKVLYNIWILLNICEVIHFETKIENESHHILLRYFYMLPLMPNVKHLDAIENIFQQNNVWNQRVKQIDRNWTSSTPEVM